MLKSAVKDERNGDATVSLYRITAKIRLLVVVVVLVLGFTSATHFLLYRFYIQAEEEASHMIRLVTQQRDGFSRVFQILNMLLSDLHGEHASTHLMLRAQTELGILASEISLRQNELDAGLVRLSKMPFPLVDPASELKNIDELGAKVRSLTDNLRALQSIRPELVTWRFSLWAPILEELGPSSDIQKILNSHLIGLNNLSLQHVNEINIINRIVLITSAVLLAAVGFLLVRPLLQHLKQNQSRLEGYQRRLLHLALIDPLTNLGNRRSFLNCYQKKLKGSKSPWLVVLIDLDDFKTINDIYGHDAGDTVLKGIAKRIRPECKTGAHAFRLGGDEFVLLIDLDRNTLNLHKYMRKLMKKLSATICYGELELMCGASMGVLCVKPGTQDGYETVLRKADFALRESKSMRKGAYHVYDEKDSSKEIAAEVKAKRLANALHEGEIIPYYQPIIDLQSNLVIGLEALSRWRTDKGVLPAATFIETANRFQMQYALTESVLQSVGKDLIRLRATGHNSVKVSVNFPESFLSDNNMAHKILMLTNTKDLSWLGIEILETALLHRSIDVVRNNLSRCVALGASVALDDFGTGHASLMHLRNFPCDTVKIDKSFVSDLLLDENASKIVTGVIDIAHGLNLAVIVEGIETMEQFAFFDSGEKLFGQGYLFSKALDIETLLQNWSGGHSMCEENMLKWEA